MRTSSNDTVTAHERTNLVDNAPVQKRFESPQWLSFLKSKLVTSIAMTAIVLCFWIANTRFEPKIQMAECHKTNVSFPEGFVWGAATSSYQIEGAAGRGTSIWDTFCPSHCSGDDGRIACDHYHRVESDVKLMKDLGLKAYRFSVSWSRILPQGSGTANQDGLDFYRGLIDALIANDIEPWVTLYHWDLPQALQDQYGGWLSQDIIDDFSEFARICFLAFGSKVNHWITINEPWTVAVNGYNNGIHAPGRSSDTEPYIVAHHLILAHAQAVKIYRSLGLDGVIGISNSGDYRYPKSGSREDEEAAERAMQFQIAWFCDPIWKGEYPEVMRERIGDRLPRFTPEERRNVLGSSDFVGLNHYSSLLASAPKEKPNYSGYWADIHVDFSHDPSWKRNDMQWSIVPDGCRDMLKWIDDRYNKPVIYITENGSAEYELDLETALQDYGRRDYFEGYIRACHEAIRAGVELKGYFAWSLMDNFEWQFGYHRRFGICYVDYDTLERTPKLSALWYSKVIEANGIK